MKIHRSNPEGRFTIIPDETLRDSRLSYLARGVLGEILSRPDDWQTSADAIAIRAQADRGRQGEGRRGIRAAFAELAEAGYLRRNHSRGPGGRMVTEVHVYDYPQAAPGGTSVRPGQTDITAGQADDHPGGTSVRPGQTGVSAVGTDVPLTDDHPGGTFLLRPTTETDNGDGKNAPETEGQGHPSPFPNPGNGNGPDYSGPDDQQPPIEVHHQSPAADRNAREDTPAGPADPAPGDDPDEAAKEHQRRELDRIAEWARQHPEADPDKCSRCYCDPATPNGAQVLAKCAKSPCPLAVPVPAGAVP